VLDLSNLPSNDNSPVEIVRDTATQERNVIDMSPSDVPREAMGMQAAGNDQSSLRLQSEPTANPTPEVSALGGGATILNS
jgi:hypothetical protein